MTTKIKLNEYQQTLFDTISPKYHTPKKWIRRIIQQIVTWTIIVALYYVIKEELPLVCYHWLNFAIIGSTVYVLLGVGLMFVIRFVFFGFSVALKIDEDEKRLNSVYKGIKELASTGMAQSLDPVSPYRIFDLISDLILFAMLISTNYLTIGTIFFIGILAQWGLAISTRNCLYHLLSKVPDPLEKDGKKANIDELMNDLCSGDPENNLGKDSN